MMLEHVWHLQLVAACDHDNHAQLSANVLLHSEACTPALATHRQDAPQEGVQGQLRSFLVLQSAFF